MAVDDCINSLNMELDGDGNAVKLLYTTRKDATVKSVGFSDGSAGSNGQQEFGKDGCLVGLEMAFEEQ